MEIKIKTNIAKLIAYFSDKNKSRQDAVTAWLIQQNLTEMQVETLFKTIIETCDYFPTISTINKILIGDTQIRAAQRYQELLKLERRTGYFDMPVWDQSNIDILHTLKIGWGGWKQYKEDSQQEIWKQKKFIDYYVNRGVIDTINLIESVNNKEIRSGLKKIGGKK